MTDYCKLCGSAGTDDDYCPECYDILVKVAAHEMEVDNDG